MAENQPPPPQSTFPPGFAPPPPPGFAPPPEYAYGQTQPLNPPPPDPNVMVEPQPMVMTTGQDYVPDNMFISILSIFCCPIIGIIATIMANGAIYLADQPRGLEQAKRDAATAKRLAIVAIVIGCFLVIIFVIFNYILPFIIGTIAFTNVLEFLKNRNIV